MKTKTRGFTMIELVVVIVLIGILGAVATARYVDSAGFDASAYAEQTRSMLRYGQKVAIAQHRKVWVVFNSGRIALCFATTCAAADRVLAPARSTMVSDCADPTWYCESTPSGLAYELLGASPGNFFFDALGQPNMAPGTSLFSGMAVRITGAGNNRDVNVSAETGYVY